jgi:hypothetical protein
MKMNSTQILLIILFVFTVQSAEAQMDSTSHKSSFQTWVITNYKHFTREGLLFSLQDSSLSILERPSVPFYDKSRNVTTIDIKSIDILKFRKKGQRGKTMLICSLSGLGVGLLVSLLSNLEHNDPTKYIIPVMFTGLGAGAGAIFGSMKIVIPIKGSLENYKSVQNELKKYKS